MYTNPFTALSPEDAHRVAVEKFRDAKFFDLEFVRDIALLHNWDYPEVAPPDYEI